MGVLLQKIFSHCAHVQDRKLPAREREHCRSHSADPGVLVEASVSFFTVHALCLKTVDHILECDHFITFKNMVHGF